MTASYHLIVPLPAGRTDTNKMRLSVLFVPRLQADGALSTWVRDWNNWPRVILGTAPGGAPPLALNVGIDAGGGFAVAPANAGITAASANWLTADPSDAAWAAVWGTGTSAILVERFRARLRTATGLLAPMYDAAALASGFEQLEDQLVSAFADRPPTRGELLALPGFDTLSAALTAYSDHLAPLGPGTPTPNTPDKADFHVGVSYAMSHPELLRVLGLLVDLEVAIPTAATGRFRLSVQSNFELSYPQGKTVPMVIDVEPDGWTDTGAGRWAAVGDASHSIQSVDLPATVDGMQQMASEVAAGGEPVVPPTHAAGLYVTRQGTDLLAEIESRWQAQADLEGQIDSHITTGLPLRVPIDGDATIAGRRYDVFDDTVGAWFSLWEREVPNGFVFPRSPSLVVPGPQPDEGWMTYTAFTEASPAWRDPGGVNLNPDPNPNPEGGGTGYKITQAPPRFDDTELRVSPLVFSWRNWSLVASPPGKAFSGVAGAVDAEPNVPPANMGAQVVVDYRAPTGVLPRLRYTRRYRFRARVVDLAGNSLELAATNPGATTETALVRFGRTNPIGAPVPVRRAPRPVPGWGDTVTTLVIKSELQQPNASVVPTSRLLFPASTSQYQCELHGFPAPDGLFTDPATFAMVVDRTAKSVESQTAPDASTGELVVDPVESWRPDVGYLIEPAQSGIGFHDLPQTTSPHVVDVPRTWPEHHAVGFEIRAGSQPPQLTAGGTDEPGIVAYVPKGVTRTVFAGAAIDSSLANHWATVQRLGGTAPPSLVAQIVSGGHWRFSAPRELTLIHAVRRPLSVPVIGPIAPTRTIESTQMSLAGTYGIDVKSTGQVNVSMSWTDPIDSTLSPTGVVARTTTRRCFEQPIAYDETTSAAVDPTPFEVGDTKRHDALLSLEAVSRYWRYFAERTTIRFTAPGQVIELAPEGVTDLNVDVMLAGDRFAPSDFVIDGPAGTIARAASTAIPLDVDIDVDFVRLPINRLSEEDGSGPFPFIIPNTVPPPPAAVAEVLPAFRRQRGVEGGAISVYHEGQTVRIWLERPWFLSGPGELLGVLVGADSGTELARDPLSPSGPTAPLTVSDFDTAVATRADVRPGVDVAGHEVHFDPVSERWFADLVIIADVGYRPFLKLALVRFQPESVDGAHIGDAVVTEPVRLGPSRLTTVNLSAAGDQLEVSVWGRELGNEMIVQVQESDPDIADLDLSWRDVGAPVTLTATPSGGYTDWLAQLPVPVSDFPVRVVVEDAELLRRQNGAASQLVRTLAYVETIDLDPQWTTPVSVPDAPDGVVATPRNQSLLVTWNVPADGNSPITHYVVQRRTGSDPFGSDLVVSPPTTSALLTGLTNGVAHDVRVRADNAIGQGPWSTVASGTPSTTVPGTVGSLTTRAGHRAALVRWAAPDDGGSPIVRYRVERRLGAGAWLLARELTPSRTTLLDRGLTNGSSYQYRVRGENALGAGPWTTSDVVVPAPMAPGRVRRLLAFTGDGRVVLLWRDAADRGSPVQRYAIEGRAPGGAWGDRQTVAATANELAITTLAAGSSWQFRIRAENAVGAGDWSNPVSVVVDASGSVPDAVHGVTVAARGSALDVSWIAAPDGGAPLFRHTVELRPPGGAWQSVDVPISELVHVFRRLTNGTTYDVRVRGENAVGVGAWSAVFTGTPTP